METSEFKLVDPNAYNSKIKMSKEKPIKFVIPHYVLKIISDNNFIDLDDNEAAKIFLQAMYSRRIRGTRITKIFNEIKPLYFPTTTISPNTLAFDSRKAAQVRVPNFIAIKKTIDYVMASDDPKRWPILLAYYSGLRSSEVVRFKASNLMELLDHRPTVTIARKTTADWTPIYFKVFNVFITEMATHFERELTAYEMNGMNVFLFPYTPRNLNYYFSLFYTYANKEPAINGFGMHVLRYYVSSKIVLESDDKELASQFLGHKSLKTTDIYIKTDELRLSEKLKQINKTNTLYQSILNNKYDPNNITTLQDIRELY